MFLLCFGETFYDPSQVCPDIQEYSYIASIRVHHNELSKHTFSKPIYGYGNVVANGVIISGDGKNKVLSTLAENSDDQERDQQIERGQQMVDSVLPGMFKQAGCRNVKALIFRALCKR